MVIAAHASRLVPGERTSEQRVVRAWSMPMVLRALLQASWFVLSRALPLARTSTAAARPLQASWLALAMLLCAASPARAERAVMLGVIAELGVPTSERAAVEAAARDFLARHAPPLEVVAPGAAASGEAPAVCAAPECAGQVARDLHVDFVALMRVFVADHGQRAGSVSAALVTPAGIVYAGTSAVDAQGLAAAAQRALLLADERRMRGPGPWLRIRAPAGSRVRIDGGAYHDTPYLDRHEPGLHQVVVVNAEGAVLHRGAITLADDPAAYEQLDLVEGPVAAALERAPARPPRGYFDRPRSRWNLYVGIPLTAGGVALLAAGAAHFAKRGECVNGDCTQVHGVNALSWVLLTTGAGITAVSGTVFLALGILREPDMPPSGASIALSGRF